MRLALLIAFTIPLCAQTRRAESIYETASSTVLHIDEAVTLKPSSPYGRIVLSSTEGGGLQIRDGSYVLIAEVLADGSIKGDLVRAARMLAAVLAAQQKTWAVKPSPDK